MSAQVRQTLADRRAQYFSDLTPGTFGSEGTSDDLNVSGELSSEEGSESGGERKPSYVGLSHAVNGYTPYSQYNGRLKKISPPLQIPVSPPRTLDSVGLVLTHDSYHRHMTQFEDIMRDLSNGAFDNMGRPQRNATDMIDAAAASKRHLISNGSDNYYPKTHSRQLIGEGDVKSVEIVTKFHSDDDHSPTYNRQSSPGKQNLVQKQIERLYGDTLCQVRMTSPEPDNGVDSDKEKTPERKISGGFFAKRFGICKQKDHSRKVAESPGQNGDNSAESVRPLKVPAVFRLLRPEFREQLKQSSCKIEVGNERIIPIRRENSAESPISAPVTEERTVPIVTSNGVHHNNNNNKSPPSSSSERVIPIRRESGDINSTPKRPVGLAPKVNGFSSVNGSSSSSSVKSSEADQNGKQNIVRKLSPLSPKHIVVGGEKPAPMPKPDHLKSPPMSPEPQGSTTPPLSQVSTPPQAVSADNIVTSEGEVCSVPVAANDKPVVTSPPVVSPPTHHDQPAGSDQLHHEQAASDQLNGDSGPHDNHDTTVALVNTLNLNNNHKPDSNPQEEEDYDNPDEYPEEFYYENTAPAPCGLRERELLCPIMEEDNESTASGSIMNLAPSNPPVIEGSGYSPDDPLLISDQGEVQDGHYFIKVLENEIFKFEENICDFEEDLNSGANIPEDVKDTILTVIGMAKLLMAQKLTQFRELCNKNINVSIEEDPFVPTCHDLAGFWDMVSIQVDQIHGRFTKLVDLRKAGWVVKKPEVVKNNKTATKKTTVNKSSKPKEKSEAAKARDEARKKMMEEKRRMMKEKAKKQSSGDDDTMIMIM